MKEDAQIAKGENNSNTVRYLYLTPTIVIMDEDIDRLDETTNLIRTTIKNVVNFNARIETVNAMDAYLGSLPSHTYENVRRPLLHTGNMTHIVP
ncbi:TPA: conjugal transfer protein TrbE, partial [Proteus mirabilis]|nr:conjugal transfer protein TrbE [Proteus mirabilis]